MSKTKVELSREKVCPQKRRTVLYVLVKIQELCVLESDDAPVKFIPGQVFPKL